MSRDKSQIKLRPKLLVICVALSILLLFSTEYAVPHLHAVFIGSASLSFAIGHIVLTIVSGFAGMMLLALLVQEMATEKTMRRPFSRAVSGILTIFAIFLVLLLVLAVLAGFITAFTRNLNTSFSGISNLVIFPLLLNAFLIFGSGNLPIVESLKKSVKKLPKNYIYMLLFELAVVLLVWLASYFPDIVREFAFFLVGAAMFYVIADVLPKLLMWVSINN